MQTASNNSLPVVDCWQETDTDTDIKRSWKVRGQVTDACLQRLRVCVCRCLPRPLPPLTLRTLSPFTALKLFSLFLPTPFSFPQSLSLLFVSSPSGSKFPTLSSLSPSPCLCPLTHLFILPVCLQASSHFCCFASASLMSILRLRWYFDKWPGGGFIYKKPPPKQSTRIGTYTNNHRIHFNQDQQTHTHRLGCCPQWVCEWDVNCVVLHKRSQLHL